MTNKPTGGPAYPSTNAIRVGDCMTGGHAGLTIRDAIAIAAMQGTWCSMGERLGNHDMEWISQRAYDQADAMLLEREK